MYTEKITLRLTKTDKEHLQIEADNKKLPLTTFIRNKISGDELESNEPKEFEPQVISIDYREYKLAEHQTRLKINTVDSILKEAKRFIEIPGKTTDDFQTFLNNPVQYVTDILYDKHSQGISFKISKHKLLELMEIDLSGLESASSIYNQHKGKIIIDENGNLKSGVNIEGYTSYTRTEADNNRLKLANDIISAYERAYPYNKAITNGNVKQTFSPILLNGTNKKNESVLVPCESWVLGKR